MAKRKNVLTPADPPIDPCHELRQAVAASTAEIEALAAQLDAAFQLLDQRLAALDACIAEHAEHAEGPPVPLPEVLPQMVVMVENDIERRWRRSRKGRKQ